MNSFNDVTKNMPRPWLRVQRFDVRAILRWAIAHKKPLFQGWCAVGGTITFIILRVLWGLGGTPAVPAHTERTVWGMQNIPAQAGTPGFLEIMLHHWWSWPLLLVVVPVLTLFSPSIILGLLLMPLAIALWIAFGPIALVVGMVAAPLLLLFGAPTKLAKQVLEVVSTTDEARAVVHKFQDALSLNGGIRRGADGRIQVMEPTERDAYNAIPHKGAGFLLGELHGEAFSAFTDTHIDICMPTGSGKNYCLVAPNLRIYPGSVFVLDPKGESARETFADRERFGSVFALDPFGVSGVAGHHFNPLAALDSATLVTGCQTLATALIPGEGDDHWTKSARMVLAAIIGHIQTAADIEARDLVSVRQFIMDDMQAGLGEMRDNMAAPQFVREIGAGSLDIDDREWSSVLSTLRVETQWLEDPAMQEALSGGGEQVNFRDYLTGTMSVFVCLPAPYFATFSKWLRLVTAAALDTMMREPMPLELPVRFILDEIAQLGHLKEVESALTLARGYKVQLIGVWQHIADKARCYPRSGVQAWDSCSGLQLVAAADMNTAKHYAELSGAVDAHGLLTMNKGLYLAIIKGESPAIITKAPAFT